MQSEKVPQRSTNLVFWRAVSFLGAAKVAAVSSQALALPIAIKYCGLETYSLYLAMVALTMLPASFLIRLSPAFVGRTAFLSTFGDKAKASLHFKTGVLLSAIGAVVSLLVSLFVVLFAAHAPTMKPNFDFANLVSFLTLLVLTIGSGFVMAVETHQSGMQESDLQARRALISSAVSILCLVFFVPAYGTLLSLVLSINAVQFVSRLINAFLYLKRHSFLRDGAWPKRKDLSRGAAESIPFTVVSGPFVFLSFHCPIVLLSLEPQNEIAPFAIVMIQLSIQLVGFLNLVIVPIVPAIAAAVANDQIRSLNRYLYWGVVFLIAASLSFVMVGYLLMPYALTHLSISKPMWLQQMVFSVSLACGALLESYLLSAAMLLKSQTVARRVYFHLGFRSVLCAIVVYLCVQADTPVYVIPALALSYWLYTLPILISYVRLMRKAM